MSEGSHPKKLLFTIEMVDPSHSAFGITKLVDGLGLICTFCSPAGIVSQTVSRARSI